MIVTLSNEAPHELAQGVKEKIRSFGNTYNVDVGEKTTVIGARGFVSPQLEEEMRAMVGEHNVRRISEPYKEASRVFHPSDTVFEIAPGTGIMAGGSNLLFIAGPCAAESLEQTIEAAEAAKQAGAKVLRGGAFKPRTGPYSFQGLGEPGLEILARAKEETGMPVVSEILSKGDIPLFEKYDIDVLQIGARNAQNYTLLKELAHVKKPLLMKNGLSTRTDVWLQSVEYLLSGYDGDVHNGGGNPNVILCSRGVDFGADASKYPMDIAMIPHLRMKTHLPVIGDPSHQAGYREKVIDVGLAMIASGAGGLEVDVHPNPKAAKVDGPQALSFNQLQLLFSIATEMWEARKKLPDNYRSYDVKLAQTI